MHTVGTAVLREISKLWNKKLTWQDMKYGEKPEKRAK